MLLTDDAEAADKVRKWSTQAREAAPWYEHEELGYNYRMSNINAGIARGQMLHATEHVEMKKAIYDRYKEGFKDLPVIMNPYDEQNAKPNFWLSCLLIDKEAMGEHVRSNKKALYRHIGGKSTPTEYWKQWQGIMQKVVLFGNQCICSHTILIIHSLLEMVTEEQDRMLISWEM